MNENAIKQEKTNINHVVTIDNRKKMMLTAIVEVVSATDKTIIAKTSDKTINIFGGELRVAKLSLEEGVLVVEGVIDSFKYMTSTGKGVFKRLFK